MRGWIPWALGLVVVLSGCTRQETEHAEAEAREAGQQAGAALERAGEQVQQTAEQVQRAAQPTAEDMAITAKVKSRLAADPEVSALAIDVDTTNKVVTLSGQVTNEAERAEAEKLAKGTDGVAGVVNRLTAGPGTPAVAATPSSGG